MLKHGSVASVTPKDLMIDIETLAKTPDAVVTTIGLAVFDPEGIVESMELKIDYKNQPYRSICKDTLMWWLGQPKEAIDAWRSPDKEVFPIYRLEDAVLPVRELIEKHSVGKVWANSPSFDLVILRDAWKTDTPWWYTQERDFRTLKSFFAPDVVEVVKNQCSEPIKGLQHCAEYDALVQAAQTIELVKRLKD